MMSVHEYTIRDVAETDIMVVLKMHAQSWIDTYPNEGAGVSSEWVKRRTDQWLTDENIQKRRDFIRKSNQGDSIYRVAEDEEGSIVGIAICRKGEDKYMLGALYIDKSHQGSGVAQQLMDQVVAWVDPTYSLELEVVAYNERAKAFYRKYGFKEVRNSGHILHEILPVITMEKEGDKQ